MSSNVKFRSDDRWATDIECPSRFASALGCAFNMTPAAIGGRRELEKKGDSLAAETGSIVIQSVTKCGAPDGPCRFAAGPKRAK
jgi:hypothetical protein